MNASWVASSAAATSRVLAQGERVDSEWNSSYTASTQSAGLTPRRSATPGRPTGSASGTAGIDPGLRSPSNRLHPDVPHARHRPRRQRPVAPSEVMAARLGGGSSPQPNGGRGRPAVPAYSDGLTSNRVPAEAVDHAGAQRCRVGDDLPRAAVRGDRDRGREVGRRDAPDEAARRVDDGVEVARGSGSARPDRQVEPSSSEIQLRRAALRRRRRPPPAARRARSSSRALPSSSSASRVHDRPSSDVQATPRQPPRPARRRCRSRRPGCRSRRRRSCRRAAPVRERVPTPPTSNAAPSPVVRTQARPSGEVQALAWASVPSSMLPTATKPRASR